MKNKSRFFHVLLVLAVLSTACAAQEATDEPGGVPAMPTATEAEMTASGAPESLTPVQGAEGTAVGSQTELPAAGLPDSLEEVLRVLRETGVTVDLGNTVSQNFLSVPGQAIMIDGEEVQIFTYASAEELEAQISLIPDDGNLEDQPQFYRLGSMLVYYAGNDPGVRDLLEDVLGAQSVGQS